MPFRGTGWLSLGSRWLFWCICASVGRVLKLCIGTACRRVLSWLLLSSMTTGSTFSDIPHICLLLIPLGISYSSIQGNDVGSSAKKRVDANRGHILPAGKSALCVSNPLLIQEPTNEKSSYYDHHSQTHGFIERRRGREIERSEKTGKRNMYLTLTVSLRKRNVVETELHVHKTQTGNIRH